MVVDRASGSFREQFGDAEWPLQLQVRPVVERIAQRRRNRAGPRLELFLIGRVAGAKTFRDAVGPHGSPLVVIPVEPDPGQRTEAMVAGDLCHGQVTVIVDDGKAGHIAVVEVARDVGLQQEVFVDERQLRATPRLPFPGGRGLAARMSPYNEVP